MAQVRPGRAPEPAVCGRQHWTNPRHAGFAFLGNNTDRRPFMDDAAELEAARIRLGTGATWEDVDEEVPGWTLPAQVDSDREADMTWGDVGTPYWLIRPEDLAALDFAASAFTWQCT